ncbi:MAG TPA: tetratricopeptide repeat protein [Gemmatimonadales bacterium]|nr:tetratricopeptide repeat protein [Gemmatimonadales bacterium]
MNAGAKRSLPPLRVEQALGLLPDIEVLAPLRALLLAASRPDERDQWSSLGPYLTVGKREVQPAELRNRMSQALGQVQTHVGALYAACIEALECQERADGVGAVAALGRAARLEEEVGRLAQAKAWYEVALVLAERLPDRRPEVELLRALGGVCHTLSRYAEGARYCQRGLALAEAEFDQVGAIAACEGLGLLALAQGEWAGAQAWYQRGLRLAESGGDAGRVGQLNYRLGELLRSRNDLTAAAEYLGRARERFEAADDAAGVARTLDVQGQVDARLGRRAAALGAFREALAWRRRAPPREAPLEVAIRLHLATLAVDSERYLEAEEELRRAEQVAIARNLGLQLIEIYTLMGALRGRQGEDTGFVFFEQAIELCRLYAVSPSTEAHVYHEYGVFRGRLGSREEARAYLEKAGGIFESLGQVAELEQVQAELQRMSA